MILLLLIFTLLASQASAATYYVATTGNDSTGDGSSENPWQTINKCVQTSGNPSLGPGDVCSVNDGTYAPAQNTIVAITSAASPNGTSGNPITLKSTNPGGAVLQVRTSENANQRGILISSRQWWIVEGFEIHDDGNAGNTGSGVALHGIYIEGSSAANIIIRKNTIHNIGRATCSNSVNGFTGIFLNSGVSNITIERNLIYTIGRLRNGESGCSTTLSQNDHGIYIKWGTDLTVRRNAIYDTNRGFPMNIYSTSSDTHTRYKIYNNTFAGRSPTGIPHGQLIIGAIWVNGEIKNNLFYQVDADKAIQTFNLSASSSGNVVSYNRTNVDLPGASPLFGGATPTGFTYSNNTENSALGFTDALCTASDGGCQNTDFTLAAGSNAINAGTAVTGISCTGVCDQGAFETFGPVSASVDTTLLDVTFDPAHGPLKVGGTAGHSVGCTTACGTLTVVNASLFSSAESIARLDVSGWAAGYCQSTQTITTSFDADVGTLTDSINIGGTLNQPVHDYGPLAVTNNCSDAGAPTPPGSPHRLYELDGDGTDTSGNGGDATVSGGSFVSGKYGQALQGTDGTAVSAASDYGSGVNPSTQDLTLVVGYEVPAGHESFNRTVAGTALGTNQRLYIATQSGTWQIGIGDSPVSVSTPSNLAVTAGWNRLCLRIDATANTATLTVNNTAGTGGASKSVASYTLASNIAFGLPLGFGASAAGGGKWDRAVIYTSLIDCNEDWLAWEPTAGPSVGTYSQTGARWYRVMDDGAGGPVFYSAAGTIEVVQDGAVIYQSQTDCTGGACSAIGEKLWYSRNGGEAQLVPDAFTSDGVAFWGSNTLSSQYLGVATCCISGSLTANNGTTQTLNVAQPSIELAQDASIVRNSVLRFASDASGTFCFHERDQNGNELASVPTACATVVAPRASGGF